MGEGGSSDKANESKAKPSRSMERHQHPIPPPVSRAGGWGGLGASLEKQHGGKGTAVEPRAGEPSHGSYPPPLAPSLHLGNPPDPQRARKAHVSHWAPRTASSNVLQETQELIPVMASCSLHPSGLPGLAYPPFPQAAPPGPVAFSPWRMVRKAKPGQELDCAFRASSFGATRLASPHPPLPATKSQ